MDSETPFDIAVSYAGGIPDETIASDIARLLRDQGIRVFFDNFLEAQLWGQPLHQRLNDVFEAGARRCVALISRRYLEHEWTMIELRAALKRAGREPGYLLPLRIDETIDLTGLLGDVAFRDLDPSGTEEVVNLLLGLLEGSGRPVQLEVKPPARDPVGFELGSFLGVVLAKNESARPIVNLLGRLWNDHAEPVTVNRMTLRLETPGSLRLPLGWHLFFETYEGGRRMRKTGDATPILVPADGQLNLGIQFQGPASMTAYAWPEGGYAASIEGSTPIGEFSAPFRLRVSPIDAHYVARWASASEADWRMLDDPDDAVAIPLTIEPA